MSTIKSSNEHLTLNADGSGKDIKFQSNGSEVASISDGGVVTATSYAGSGANLTGISSVGGATGVDFNDNVKARFGTGNDLEIFHDGSHSYIKDEGTGNLILRTAGAAIELGGDGEALATFTKDGSVELYHNNVKKVETTAAGFNVSGDLISILPAGSSREHIVFKNGSSVKGSIVSSDYTNNTSYNTTSDYRLKENVVDMENATDRLKQLQPRRFNFTANPNLTMDGFIAHEITPVVPEAVTGAKDAVDDDNNPKYQGIDQSKLVPLLVKTIQELEARITALEA